jgi:hypothetical protein
MTRDEFRNRNATAFLMFAALSEIMLDLYGEMKFIIHYDPNLYTKLKNLKANFERATAKAQGRFTESEQLVFFDMINIFESLLESSKNERNFSELMNLIKSHQKGEVNVYYSKEEILNSIEPETDKKNERN